jgi:hypothetical protein
MAHGNVSDLVFLFLLVGSIQTWAAPGFLFKATFPVADPKVGALISFTGGLAFLLGMTFSGIKWNPINGKMGGFGAFCAAANAAVLGVRTENVFFFAFAAVLIFGATHIFAFPSNPPVPKGPENKNNHGNASDLIALLLLAGSIPCIFYPSLYFQDIGPVKASFTSEDKEEVRAGQP